ncbi:MAG: asparagine synthase (glutamine-hydrolyzing) [Bacteroidota bacterium]
MCGITGIIAFSDSAKRNLEQVHFSLQQLKKRGPDRQAAWIKNNVAIGHARLSVIDLSESANQPFVDPEGRFVLAFNGEFFNYKEHREKLMQQGVQFSSDSDTEVLLQLFKQYGVSCIPMINGFFAFAVYDTLKEELVIARDRYGEKPLLYFQDHENFVFASELKALLKYNCVPRNIDFQSLLMYLQLNYIPSPFSMLEGVSKVEPGHYLSIKKNGNDFFVEDHTWYTLALPDTERSPDSYEDATIKVKSLLEDSVRLRLISDVPLGVFLSGGIDSSIVTALAAKHQKKVKTFTIGFKDDPVFDESQYASVIANKYNTDHTTFFLSEEEIFSALPGMMDYLDEPFADSSALAVYVLSREVKKHVTVALSGDGADEFFGGYNKHWAELFVRNHRISAQCMRLIDPFSSLLRGSRHSKAGNFMRKANRLAEGAKMNAKERYWRWCGLNSEKNAMAFLSENRGFEEYHKRKQHFLEPINGNNVQGEDIFYSDVKLVLQGDMLVKTDMMSMAGSLEVRSPFLDYRLADYVNSLPGSYRLAGKNGKRILKDAFQDELPPEILSRKKHGFEVPLRKWLMGGLQPLISDMLESDFVKKQNIFSNTAVNELKFRLQSNRPGDATAQMYALLIFQNWYKKYIT